jgi:hypothetical protein
MAAKCKTCGTPLDQIPFEPCPEHAIHEKLASALSNVLEELPTSEAKRLARQKAVDGFYDVADPWGN